MGISVIQSIIDGILMGGVYALAALGVSLIFGVMKITNFAHGALVTVGMYAAFVICTALDVNPYIILPIVIVVMFLLGYLIQRYIMNLIIDAPGHNQLLLTLGMSIVLQNLLLLIFSATPRTISVPALEKALVIGSVTVNKAKLAAFIIVVVVALLIYLILYKTDIGKAIRATSMMRNGATLMGINVNRINAVAFGLGVACAGLAGALLTPIQNMSPTSGDSYQLTCFVIAVFGGLGNIGGAIVAGLIIGVVQSISSLILGGSWSDMIIYLIFVLTLLLKPTGLFGKKGR